MKKVIVMLCLFALWACKDTEQKPVEKPAEAVERANLEEAEAPVTKTIVDKEEKKVIDLLLPMYYDKDFHEEEVKTDE